MSIKIITDSSSEISTKIAQKYNIDILPLTINFGNESFRDGIDLTHDEFYSRLAKCKELPKTSQVNEFTFAETFNKYPDDTIFCLTISSNMSGTYAAAVAARDSLNRKNIFVVDSRNTTLPLGALITELAKFVQTESDSDKILDYINLLIKKVRMYAVVGSLKHLKAGGRISSLMSVVGTILNIKPIMSVKDGKVYNTHKSIGLKNAEATIYKMSLNNDPKFPMYFGHTDSSLAMQNLINTHFADYKYNKDEQILKVGATVGTHIGLGCYGVIVFLKDSLMEMPK